MNAAKSLLILILGSVACCPAEAQQNPNGQILVTTLADPYLVLIRDPVVQDELRLNNQQRAAVRALTDQLDCSIWPLRNQRGEESVRVFNKLNATAETGMNEILTSSQQKRLAQLRVAVFGLSAFLRDDVAAKLDLSEQQRTQIREILDKAVRSTEESQHQTENGKPPANPANAAQRRIAAILSRQQIEKVRDVLGPPVNTSKLGYVKFKAPELDGKDGWLNSQPLTMSQLRGKVVALHFWTFG